MLYGLLIYGDDARWETFGEAEQVAMTEEYMAIGRDPKTKEGSLPDLPASSRSVPASP